MMQITTPVRVFHPLFKKLSYMGILLLPMIMLMAQSKLGVWSFTMPFVAYIIIPILDYALGEDHHNVDPSKEIDFLKDSFYDLVLYAYTIAFFGSSLWVIYYIATTPMLWWEYVGLIWSLGIMSGVFNAVAHELGHRYQTKGRTLALAIAMFSGYAHTINVHNRVHHRWVATPKDPASAVKGQSFYNFFFKSLIGAVRESLALEKQRLNDLKLSAWNLRNVNYVNLGGPVIWAIVVFAIGSIVGTDNPGLWGLGGALTACIAYLFLAWSGATYLEVMNYLEHYGLRRRELPDGGYERTTHRHSWNSSHFVSNALLVHLERHSDHHAAPNRRYQILRHFEDSPNLPSGYALMMVLVLIPPLWFKVMDKRVEAWERSQPPLKA